jgi:hypothetical protein
MSVTNLGPLTLSDAEMNGTVLCNYFAAGTGDLDPALSVVFIASLSAEAATNRPAVDSSEARRIGTLDAPESADVLIFGTASANARLDTADGGQLRVRITVPSTVQPQPSDEAQLAAMKRLVDALSEQ